MTKRVTTKGFDWRNEIEDQNCVEMKECKCIFMQYMSMYCNNTNTRIGGTCSCLSVPGRF